MPSTSAIRRRMPARCSCCGKRFTEDERFYPSEELTAKLEVYENLGKQMLSRYNDLFLEFKMYAT